MVRGAGKDGACEAEEPNKIILRPWKMTIMGITVWKLRDRS
jgi:hypothetical protein